MKLKTGLLFLIYLAPIFLLPSTIQAIRIMSFNFQQAVPLFYNYQQLIPSCLDPAPKQSSKNREYNVKRSLAVKLLNDFSPDIIGFQEPHLGDVEFFKQKLSVYQWVGAPIIPLKERDRLQVFLSFGKAGSDYNPIFYNTKKYKLLDSGDFWLNEHMEPGEPSTSWSQEGRKHFHIRACTWAKLKDTRSGNVFWVFNTHHSLDQHIKLLETELVERESLRMAGSDPVFFIGDLNTTRPYTQTFVDAKNHAQKKINSHIGSRGTKTIDYILMHNIPTDTVSLYGVVDYAHGYTKNGIVPSDHRPVYADIAI